MLIRYTNTQTTPCAIAEDDEKEFQSLLEELIEEDQSSSSVNRDSTENTTASTSFPYLHPPSYYRQPKIGRRRSTNPTYMPELRIFRRDVRRRYGEMFMNVANNHDPSLVEKFVQEFCRPDCQFVALRPTDLQSRRAMEQALQKKQDTVTNMKEMVQGFAFNFEMMPDSVFRLEECQVRVKQGTAGSVVVGRATIRGTRIYRLELRETPNTSAASEESWESSSISSYDDVSSISTHSTTSGTSDDSPSSCTSNEEMSTLEHQIQHENHDVSPCGVMGDSGNNLYQQRYRWTPIETPMDSLMEAIFSMSLDETHHIQRFQMACQSYQERPAGLAH